jgi:hypothetical protein
MLVPHIIVWSLVKSSLNKRKLRVRRVLGGSEDIQGRSKGISRVFQGYPGSRLLYPQCNGSM